MRTLTTLFATVFLVKNLRTMGLLSSPPSKVTMGELVRRQREILVREKVMRTEEDYRAHYRRNVRKKFRSYKVAKQRPPGCRDATKCDDKNKP